MLADEKDPSTNTILTINQQYVWDSTLQRQLSDDANLTGPRTTLWVARNRCFVLRFFYLLVFPCIPITFLSFILCLFNYVDSMFDLQTFVGLHSEDVGIFQGFFFFFFSWEREEKPQFIGLFFYWYIQLPKVDFMQDASFTWMNSSFYFFKKYFIYFIFIFWFESSRYTMLP